MCSYDEHVAIFEQIYRILLPAKWYVVSVCELYWSCLWHVTLGDDCENERIIIHEWHPDDEVDGEDTCEKLQFRHVAFVAASSIRGTHTGNVSTGKRFFV